MKERWKIVESLLSDEYGIEVQGSYEGWGAGYDPISLPLTEMWAKGEVDDIPLSAKRPLGVVFYINELSKRKEDYAINAIRHEIEYLFNTDLYLWKLGQREFFKFGFPPTSFLVLYSVLESLKVDEKIVQKHPSSLQPLIDRYRDVLRNVEVSYPHHRFSLSFLRKWLCEERLQKDLERFLYEYVCAENKDAYDILIEDLLGKYISYIEKAQELNYIDLLLDEARGRVRQDAHRGRIMTDLLKKLPQHMQEIIVCHKEKDSSQMDEGYRKEVLKSLRSLPDWMKDYLKQMSYIDMVEKDVEFIRHFLPKTLEVEIEHKGFLSFLVKGWEEMGESFLSPNISRGGEELSEEDKFYGRAYGMDKREFSVYRSMLRDIGPYLESMKRKLQKIMPLEDEGWVGGYFYGRRIDNKAVNLEIPMERGRMYKRRHVPIKKELAFKLLIDISSSMKREDKIKNAIMALLLFCEIIHSMRMPFSIDVFSEKTYRLKDFDEEYNSIRWRIVELFKLVGGATNLEKAILYSYEDTELFCRKNHIRGCLLVFSDGEPTRGLKGEELKEMIRQIKGRMELIGIGLGRERNYIDYYFEGTGIKIGHISELPSAFARLIQNQVKRLVAFQ
ncbi:MAG: VWA domain-containing protein [Acidobacteria bacterium]|nr:MAG: VWA domain-containing protein [Acidobacteriota bacterium]